MSSTRTLVLMQDSSLVQLKDFTHDTAAKAIIAGGTVLTASLHELVCGSSRTGFITCQVIGGLSQLLKLLLGMMFLDLLTGVLASRAEGQRIQSSRLSIGMKRKLMMLIVVAASALIDGVFQAQGLPTGHVLYKWTASWFIAVEALSLYENAGRLGVPLPKFLKTAMEFLLQRADSGGSVERIIETAAGVVEASAHHDSPTEHPL